LYYSPGGLTEFNHSSDFNQLRANAEANYFYGRLNVERITRLPGNFSWIIRGWAQYSNARLLPSEQLAVGGYNTVRGYDETAVLGDYGWMISNEIRTPPWSPPFRIGNVSMNNLLGTPDGQDFIQLLAFFDYGAARVKDEIPADSNPNRDLYSVGMGLRYTVSKNFALRFDYGFPLAAKDLNENSSRGHIGALLSF
jgi:hemolysin activation/secretion protein